MAHLEFFPPELIALRKELEYHPALILQLRLSSSADIGAQVAEIAAHIGIAVDGVFSPYAFRNLCAILTEKLQEKRTIVLN